MNPEIAPHPRTHTSTLTPDQLKYLTTDLMPLPSEEDPTCVLLSEMDFSKPITGPFYMATFTPARSLIDYPDGFLQKPVIERIEFDQTAIVKSYTARTMLEADWDLQQRYETDPYYKEHLFTLEKIGYAWWLVGGPREIPDSTRLVCNGWPFDESKPLEYYPWENTQMVVTTASDLHQLYHNIHIYLDCVDDENTCRWQQQTFKKNTAKIRKLYKKGFGEK